MKKPVALVVEDDPMLGQIYCKTLEGDFDVDLISNGAVALEHLETMTPEAAPLLLILDINLPGASGLKIYERLHARMKAEPALERVHVIICSADTQATELLRDEADLTLLKPVSPMQLRTLAGRILSRTS